MKARHEQTADNNNNKSHDVSSYQSVVSPLKSTCTEEAMEQVAVKQVITSNEMPPRQEQPSAPNGPSGVHVSRRIHHQEPNSSDQPNCTNEPVAQTPTNQLLDTHKPSITMNRPHLHNQHINLNHIKTRCRRRPQTSTPNQTNYQAGAARCHYGTSAPASHLCCWPHRSLVVPVTSAILLTGLTVLILTACGANSVQPNESNLRFDQQTGAYQGLTFTFDPRLDKQVEQRLHHEHWLSIMQQSSSLLYESLNGRAHLAEIKVLIPFKWRQLSAELRPVLYKPGSPVITNRRLRFADSDVIVGFEDPVYKETPFSLQHDECGRPGLNIRMPISFLDQQQPQQQQSATKPGGPNHQYLDSRLKARQFVREFASHRFGIFKESGFRSDYMYPPFSSVAGLSPLDHQDAMTTTSGGPHGRWGQLVNGTSSPSAMELVEQLTNGNGGSPVNRSEQQQQEDSSGGGNTLRGFDEHFQECKFETSPSSGLPANAQAANCLPYLVRADKSLSSFNLMSSDPFVYAPIDRTTAGGGGGGSTGSQPTELPVQWDDLAEQTRWHFCGENFPNPNYASSSSSSSSSGGSTTNQLDQTQASSSSSSTTANNNNKLVHYEHNQRATNKQNKMCQERSTLEVIRMSEDFRNHQQFSPSNFNRLPTPNFKFLQEMPPRLIMCIEYTSHLFQSRRLDHPILESAINKFLALDLIAESELATVVFGQHQSRLLDSSNFQKLDSSLNSRFTLFNPAIDPFDEQVQYYSQSELAQMDVQSAAALMMSSSSGAAAASAQNGAATGAGPSSVNSQQQQPVKILKGSCSFAKMMAEVNVLLQKSSMQYDDIGADLIVLTSGLFIEDEPKIEEILRSSNFKLENNRLNMIIYPSSMLFDTKSREGIVVLDSNESEQIIRSRVSKLLLIQRLTGGKLHLIKEQLDSSGDVKMSTLVQFYQIFDQLAKGHSWDQTSSMVMLQSQQVDSRQQQQGTSNSLSGSQQQHQFKPAQYKLTFQFNLDESIQNELIVGFIDPKVQHQAQANLLDHRHHSLNSASLPPAAHKAGKRFSLKNLQLRSPGGQFVFTETNTTWTTSFPPSQGLFNSNNNQTFSDEFSLTTTGDNGQEPQESAFFPFRAQLSLAAFHVKPVHLSQLQAIKKLAGTWTLSALSDEPIQTSGVALARVNPQGDTLTGNCWIQTYNQESIFDQSSSADEQQQLKMVKVFVQTSGGSRQQRQEVETRMEVQDEMGNIVQNVQMLDDGLGAPDMTQNDGIHTQYVQRAIRPGFYKVSVELVTGSNSGRSNKLPVLTGHSGQDNVCCGSFVPNPSEPAVMSHHSSSRATRSSRQLYCGTFFVDSKSRLGHQRPPRLSNLTVVNVDQENRRVTLRWFEPQLDITSSLRVPLVPGSGNQQLVPILSETDLIGEETSESRSASSSALRASRSTRLTPPTGSSGPRRRQVSDRDEPDEDNSSNNYDDEHHRSQSSLSTLIGSNVLMASHQQHPHHQQQARSVVPLADQIDRSQSLLQNRYDIKVFFDRDMMKRAFDSKLDVGYKFNEWSVEGQFPNASQFGGMKEVTLRVPFSREGFYFIAMKVVNNIGLASQMSNIVQFYLRNNMTLEEVESIYGQPGMTVDADGNVYDKNGDLVQRGGGPGNPSSSYSLLKGTTALDGISVLILISVLAFMMVILCITLVACLASSARHSLKTNAANKTSRPHHHHHHDEGGNAKKKTIGSIVGLATGGGGSTGPISAGSGSSMVSSSGGCESSEMGACSGSSSLAGSCTGGGVGLHQNQDQQQQQLAHLGGSGSLFFDDLQPSQLTTYNKLQQQQRNQQQQAQMIHQQLISNKTTTLLKGQQQQQDFYSQPQQQQSYYGGPNHTIVNGYTYATVMQAASQQPHQDQQYQHYASGDLNQNGLVQHQVMDGTAIPTTSSAVINPVQSWPADILLSHYDKVKQARERNEAPPVMRIETLDNGLQYSDGLPTVFGEQQQQQQADLQQGQTKGLQYSTLREQQQAASYYNQQLHQQLSSVLKNKRQNMDYDGDGFRGTSPALEEISSDLLNTADGSSEQQQPTSMPPPPHYMYCPAPTGLPVDTNGLGGGGGGQLTDPSIYSQTTNLQQVMAGSPVSTQDQLASYYSNQQQQQQQWPASTTHQNPSYGMGQQHQAASLVSSSGIYSTSNLDQQQQLQQQQQQSSDAAISEV